MSIDVRTLSFSYGNTPILKDVSFTADCGEVIAILGPNGVGKSTLFRCLLGFLKADSGDLLVSGKPIASYSHRDLAREIAYIPQSYSPAFNYTVYDTVLMGVTGQLGALETPTSAQHEQVMQTLSALGIAHLASRGSRKISGGERQLMLIARALVQDAKVLLMDEPTANLDYGNSFRVMERIESLAAKGYTILFSTHDPNQAFRYASRVLALKDGALLCDGAPAEVLTEQMLSTLYGIDVAVRDINVDRCKFSVSVPYENR